MLLLKISIRSVLFYCFAKIFLVTTVKVILHVKVTVILQWKLL